MASPGQPSTRPSQPGVHAPIIWPSTNASWPPLTTTARRLAILHRLTSVPHTSLSPAMSIISWFSLRTPAPRIASSPISAITTVVLSVLPPNSRATSASPLRSIGFPFTENTPPLVGLNFFCTPLRPHQVEEMRFIDAPVSTNSWIALPSTVPPTISPPPPFSLLPGTTLCSFVTPTPTLPSVAVDSSFPTPAWGPPPPLPVLPSSPPCWVSGAGTRA